MGFLRPAEVVILERTTAIVASVSVVAVMFMFFDILITWAQVRKSPSRIVLWWTIATCLSIPGMLFGRQFVETVGTVASIMCKTQGTLLTYSVLSSAFWAACIATNMYLAISHSYNLHDIMNVEHYYHKIAWGIPAIVSITPIFFKDGYGDYITGCWISDRYSYLQIIALPVASWLCFLYTFVMYAIVGLRIQSIFRNASTLNRSQDEQHRQQRQLQRQATQKFILKSAFYLLAFFSSHIGSTVNYMYTIITGKESMTLMMLQAITLPASGLVNSVAYFMSRSLNPAQTKSPQQSTHNSVAVSKPAMNKLPLLSDSSRQQHSPNSSTLVRSPHRSEPDTPIRLNHPHQTRIYHSRTSPMTSPRSQVHPPALLISPSNARFLESIPRRSPDMPPPPTYGNHSP